MYTTMDATIASPSLTMLMISVPTIMVNGTGNFLITQLQEILAEHLTVYRTTQLAGDLSTAALLSRLLAGQPMNKMLQSTTAKV